MPDEFSRIVPWRDRLDRSVPRIAIDWRETFGRSAPLDLEIGCGNGLWLRDYASMHADRDCVGIELVSNLVRETSRRAVRDGQQNLRLMIGDAKLLVWLAFPDHSLSAAYVNFPDPWFKARHVKRRLLNAAFLRMLSTKLVIGGALWLATDDRPYFDFAIEECSESRAFGGATILPEGQRPADQPQTKYERKWRDEGRGINYVMWRSIGIDFIRTPDYIESQKLRYTMELLGMLTAGRDGTVA